MKISFELSIKEHEGILLRGINGVLKIKKNKKSATFMTVRLIKTKSKSADDFTQIAVDSDFWTSTQNNKVTHEALVFSPIKINLTDKKNKVVITEKLHVDLDIESNDKLENFWIGKLLDLPGRSEMRVMSGNKFLKGAKVNVLNADVVTKNDGTLSIESKVHQSKGMSRFTHIDAGDVIGINLDLNAMETVKAMRLTFKKIN